MTITSAICPNDKKNSKENSLVHQIKHAYKDNERLINGVGWAVLLVGALRVTADVMQAKK